jgi:hypothetical protein
MKSKMPKAKKFKKWILSEVIPKLRTDGEYIMDTKDKKEIKELNEKLHNYEKRVIILENNQSKPRYPKGGHVYATVPAEYFEKDLHKIGKVGEDEKIGNLNKRINTYNTSCPDNMILVYKIKVDNPVAVEHCIKAFLDKYIYRTNKEFYKVDEKTLIEVMETCASALKNNNINKINKLSSKESTVSRPVSKNNNDQKLIYIFYVTKEQELHNQSGGNVFLDTTSNFNSKYSKYVYLKQLYSYLKSMN